MWLTKESGRDRDLAKPEDGRWSSFRSYAYGELGLKRVNWLEWILKMKPRPVESFGSVR